MTPGKLQRERTRLAEGRRRGPSERRRGQPRRPSVAGERLAGPRV
jgi:hypothetical protein